MTSQYLYNITPTELENKLYFEALSHKLEAGKKLYKELYFNKDRTEEEDTRLFHVGRAVDFTQRLLNERD